MAKKIKDERVRLDRKVTSDDIYKYLTDKYKGEQGRMPREHVCFPELRVGTGSTADRSLDFWVMSCYSGLKRTCYEVKVSRSDFLREIKDPHKRRKGLFFSNYFYFIMPEGIAKVEEIPPECGLIELFWSNNDNIIASRTKEIEKWSKVPEVERQQGYRFTDSDESKASYSRAREWMPDWMRRGMRDGNPIPEPEEFLVAKTIIDAPSRESYPPTWDFFASCARRILEDADEVLKLRDENKSLTQRNWELREQLNGRI